MNVHLYELTMEHVDELYALIDSSRDGLSILPWIKDASFYSTNEFVSHVIEDPKRKLFGIFKEDKLVGTLEIRDKDYFYEIGYWIGTPYRGKGVMKTALNMYFEKVMENSDSNLTFGAKVRHENVASKMLLYKLGFMVVKRDKDYVYTIKRIVLERDRPF